MGIQERKQREREQRREMIIVAASKVFIEKGLGGTTMEEIASRAELSKATLYLYFKNKEELFLAVMIIVLDRFCDHMQQEMGSDKPVLQRMVTMGSNYLSFFYQYPEYFEMLNDMEPPDDFNFAQYEVSTDLVKANARIWEIICAPIIDGIKEGIFRSDTNPLEIGMMLWTSSTGIIKLMEHVQKSPHHQCGLEGLEENSAMRLLEKLDFEGMLRRMWNAITDSITTNQAIEVGKCKNSLFAQCFG